MKDFTMFDNYRIVNKQKQWNYFRLLNEYNKEEKIIDNLKKISISERKQ